MKNRKLLIIVSVLLVCTIGIVGIGFAFEASNPKLPTFLKEYTYSGFDDVFYQPQTDANGMKEMVKYKDYKGDFMDLGQWLKTGEVKFIEDVSIVDGDGRILYEVTVYGSQNGQKDVLLKNCKSTIQSMGLKILDFNLSSFEYTMLVYMSEAEALSLGYTCQNVFKIPLIDSYMYSPDDDVWYSTTYLEEIYNKTDDNFERYPLD